MKIKFHKYHGAGNDYIVIDPSESDITLTETLIRAICHRNFGVGADGILYGPLQGRASELAVRIFNPDGSRAEKSGNGMRIFARYLRDSGKAGKEAFRVSTEGGVVRSQVQDNGKTVVVEMGRVSFQSKDIPVAGRAREVIDEEITAGDRVFSFCAATIGNPHCVILCNEVSKESAVEYGPVIEIHPNFPNRTNVQFMQVLDRKNIRIEIWERGAGYTLSSGSSSCAAAAAAFRMDLCDSEITTHMPGGKLGIVIDDNYAVTMSGPVKKICEGVISDELFSRKPAG